MILYYVYVGDQCRLGEGVMSDLVLAQLNGQKINIKPNGKDNITVINLCTIWCPPCRQEIHVFADAQIAVKTYALIC
jgi:thiol-disulfide isomerase/thioredoxin